MTNGFSVRIFIPTGEPEGLRVLEKSNWTGIGLVFPRPLLSEAYKRPESTYTGVYILWGPGETSDFPRVYVGEGDVVRERLDSHNRLKEFWTHAVIFTSKDQYLNKAHVKFIEARLVELAAEAKRCELDNGNVPKRPSLSDADAADAESFLSDLLLCLPVVGATFFDRPRTVPSTSSFADLHIQSKGVRARGYDGPEGFVVLENSEVVKETAPSLQPRIAELRDTLLRQGVLVSAGGVYRVSQDYSFTSPSLAAAVVLGKSSNGRTEWKDANGRTLKELQERNTTDGPGTGQDEGPSL